MGLLIFSWFLMILLYLLLPVSDSQSVNDSEYLLSIKNSIQRDSLNTLSDWDGKSSLNHCSWYGVTCENNVTIYLNISGGLLSGKLSVDVGGLTELRVLSLANNAFYGEIPKEIGNLKFLQVLELQGNNFTGEIPGELFNNNQLFNLGLLNLSYNMLNGVIPKGLIGFGRIRVLDLSYNELSGGIKVDVSTRCQSLEYLRLSGNFLVNRIPPEIGNCSNLRQLLVDENVLEGRIPVGIGNIEELQVLDVSRNSLAGRVPKELGNCRKLEVVVLTNLLDGSEEESGRGEFNAFVGGIPYEVLMLPNLEVFWAPRANLGGRLASSWRDSCKLRVLNLGQNYITGMIPEGLGLCKNLSFLDLSSNVLLGFVPLQLHVPCMVYFNVSHNSLSGSIPAFAKSDCSNSEKVFSQGNYIDEKENFEIAYSVIPHWSSQINMVESGTTNFVVHHDFSWNNFTYPLPLFYLGDGFTPSNIKPSYMLLLNNNQLNGSLPGVLFTDCTGLESFAVDLSFNNISGGISQDLLFDCSRLIGFQAASNQISGSIPSSIGSSEMLHYLDLSGNMLTGSLPYTLEKLNHLRLILLGGNNLVGEIPAQLGNLHLLMVLDLSRNALSETIPPSLANATNLQELLLDHNNLSGKIPASFSTFAHLMKLDVSYNNLSGVIPHLQLVSDCDGFKGNNFLQPCPDPNAAPPAGLPIPLDVHRHARHKNKLKTILIGLVTSASIIVLVFLITILVLVCRRKKLGLARISSLKSKVVVTFTEVPTKLNYDGVVRATGNFSVRNLIGTGGFGATYKAELVPGFLVAVKRLAIGRFQGIQQFDAEIRTLGRIRHKNLVTLIGYYMGESEMLLIYNYLSGGNLQTFIHERSGENVKWQVIHKIALDIAQSLTYLHYYCVPRIVHRDIKPSNILLDEDLNAYLSDFGLARLLEVSETHATTDVAGTFGYVAPEYATTCRVSDKADVYSFGVVLLELMSGKKCLDPAFSNYGNGFNIVAWGNLLINEGRSSDFFSPELWEVGPKENLLVMLSLASDCTVESLSIRPSMKHVLAKLKQLRIPES
ncbi:hypothetical protein MKW98_005505 [Papaver atlanticum]|uniref:non-specific serine/threonine protein kinase n=1 Tax=Papaver atlanticum TaxID=357466 RepID=A0AAD4T8V0_9MAGN|nr:hypothetical protein MKW98_005505 [Papaver atlanticum]